MELLLVVAVPTFICSLLSLIASTTFAVFYICYPPERHFRQALIVNLLVADWLNSLNNSISGAIAIQRRHYELPLGPGPSCTANAYIGQFSVQAIDFSILVISVSVLLTVRHPRVVMQPPWWKMVAVCALPWIPPIITANIALALGIYGPVSGNWCWIERQHFGLRYGLTHGWRIAIFVATIAIYTYIYVHLMRAYGRLGVSTTSGGDTSAVAENSTALSDMNSEPKHIRVRSSITTTIEHENENDQEPLRQTWTKTVTIREAEAGESGSISGSGSPGLKEEHSQFSYVGAHRPNVRHVTNITSPALTPQARARKQAMRKMLLLNGYPILYVILWIPGIANRIAEAFGTSPVWLRALQASTQLVGLANALTYAYNEQLVLRVRGRSG